MEFVKKQRRIPSEVEAQVLFANDRTCCICHKKGKPIQIHHIDGNPANNIPDNLAVLCLEHHEEVSRKSPLSKGYTPSLVRKYKRQWEHVVRQRRRAEMPYIGRHVLSPTVSHIHLLAAQVVSYPDGDPRVKENLEILYELHLLGMGFGPDVTEDILDAFWHIALMTSSTLKATPALLAEKTYELCWHLVGPEDVPLTRRGKSQFVSCVEVLKCIGEFAGEFGRNIRPVRAACRHLFNLFEIATWYRWERGADQVVTALGKIKTACLAIYEHPRDKPLLTGAQVVRKIARQMVSLVEETKLKKAWSKIIRKLQRLMKKMK